MLPIWDSYRSILSYLVNHRVALYKQRRVAIARSMSLLNKETIDKVFYYFHGQNDNPKTELIYTNDYTLLVAIVLSAQSTDVGVNKATKHLFEHIDSPEKMVELGEENLKNYIKTIGLYNSKAKNILLLSKILIEKYSGNIPCTREELMQLPGVGRKTANVILNCAFGYQTIAVDTHVFRVSNRIGLACSNNILEVEQQLLENIPSKWLKNAHHWLILHGRYICKARNPDCNNCKINKYCNYFCN